MDFPWILGEVNWPKHWAICVFNCVVLFFLCKCVQRTLLLKMHKMMHNLSQVFEGMASWIMMF